MAFAVPRRKHARQQRKRDEHAARVRAATGADASAMSTYRSHSGRRPLGLPEEDNTLPALNPAPFYKTDTAYRTQVDVLPSCKFSQGYRFHKLGVQAMSDAHLNKVNKGVFSPGPKYMLPSTFMSSAKQKPMPVRDHVAVRHGLRNVGPRYHLQPRTGEFVFPPSQWSDGGLKLRRRRDNNSQNMNKYTASLPTSEEFDAAAAPSNVTAATSTRTSVGAAALVGRRQNFNPAFPYTNAHTQPVRPPSQQQQQQQLRSQQQQQDDDMLSLQTTQLASAFPYANASSSVAV